MCSFMLTISLLCFFELFKLSMHQQFIFAMTLRSLWRSRLSLEQRTHSTNEVACKEQNLRYTFEIIFILGSNPPTCKMKCNVGVTSFYNNSILGYNMCFKYYMRLLVLGKSDYFYFFATVLEAETIGLLEAIKGGISNRMHVVLFETNCKSLSDALATTNAPLSLVILCLSVEVSYLVDPTL